MTINSNSVTATYHLNAAALATSSTPTGATDSDTYTPLSADSILFFCQKQMRDMDTKIQGAMTAQQSQVNLQDALSDVETALKASSSGANDTVAFQGDQAAMDNANAKVDKAIDLAQQAGNTDLVAITQDGTEACLDLR